MEIEKATKEDAHALASLINMAGDGIPAYLWTAMAEGLETPLEVGARRAAREEGSFSFNNTKLIRKDGVVAGMVISYRLDDPYITGDLMEYPAVVRPFVKLESQAPGSWYVNAVATNPDFRGQGVATRLLAQAERDALANGAEQMSLIVASENRAAKRLYLNIGYQFAAALPVVKFTGFAHGGYWELLVKPLVGAS